MGGGGGKLCCTHSRRLLTGGLNWRVPTVTTRPLRAAVGERASERTNAQALTNDTFFPSRTPELTDWRVESVAGIPRPLVHQTAMRTLRLGCCVVATHRRGSRPAPLPRTTPRCRVSAPAVAVSGRELTTRVCV
ncbi:hypothetical protein ZHAS_00003954 [Anopheles sinensis]|uniref:Uncharacterized protein n=1 Tax=Anopheles sinensis TaxID=74873 RepID=A0A084VFP9_ANOSI|nr:hypothetical protein ZHAS_00003954 [Anopheles sinensis]